MSITIQSDSILEVGIAQVACALRHAQHEKTTLFHIRSIPGASLLVS